MVDTFDFSGVYGIDPWAGIDTNTRPWYDPILRERYQRAALYSRFTTMKVDLTAHKSRTVTFSDLIPPVPNLAPIGDRQMEASRLYGDSYQKDVTVERYGNGMSLHKESELFNYWQRNGDAGLIPIINQQLGQAMTDHIDMLARNTFFRTPYSYFGDGSATDVGGVTTSMKMTTNIVDAMGLGMKDREQFYAYNALPTEITGEELVCITSPGCVYDLRREEGTPGTLNFVPISLYQGGANLYNGEVGMYRGTRFVETGLALLWNCGTVIHQTTIKAAVAPGDGAPDPQTTKVDRVRRMGQKAAKHYIEVADASWMTPNMVITIHKSRADGSDPTTVVDGVDYTDESIMNVQVASVDTGHTPNRVSIKKPYLYSEGLDEDLGGTVYGYITQGRNIHTAMFMRPGQAGLICGVTQPPNLYFPPAIDDFLSIYRITYDFWMKFSLWNPEVFEVAFLAGSIKNFGRVQVI